MAVYPIFHRWSGSPLLLLEASSFPRALELAAMRRAPLSCADLKGIIAPGAFLGGVDLRCADLSHAVLSGVDLEGADLRAARLRRAFLQDAVLRGSDFRGAHLQQADLRAANLEGARLVGADLRGALFYGARLDGAILDWRWGGIPQELIRQDSKANGRSARVATDPAVEGDERPFAWLRELLDDRANLDRALSVLARSIRPEDNAPRLLRGLALDAASRPEPQSSSLYWTRRRDPARRVREAISRS